MSPNKKSPHGQDNKSDKLTILFAPMDAYGHFNASIGLAQPLLGRGHNVIFATPNEWKGKLAKLGFQEEWYSTVDPSVEASDAPSDEIFNSVVEKLSHCMAMPPQKQMRHFVCSIYDTVYTMIVNGEQQLQNIVAKTKPDIIVIDMTHCQPALVNAGMYPQ